MASEQQGRRQPCLGPGAAPTAGLFLLPCFRASSLCFLLPRVHAAEEAAAPAAAPAAAAAGQPAQMLSSSSNPAPLASSSPNSLPSIFVKPEFSDTGWDRIKDLFQRDSLSKEFPEEVVNVVKSGVAAAVIGLVYGGLPAARHARDRYIQTSQAEIYSHRVQAVRSAHNAAIRGFLRFGWRWSWRVTAFATLFNSVSVGLSVYRDKYTVSHYAAAGAITGGAFRLNLGLRGVIAGTIIGLFLGVPTGGLIISLRSLYGESAREKRRREHRELYQQQLDEWAARTRLTDNMIGDLQVQSQTNNDVERIQELLSLPRNEER